MTKNVALHSAIFTAGFFKKEVAAKLGKCPSWLTGVINGSIKIKSADRKWLAKILKVKEAELFKDSG